MHYRTPRIGFLETEEAFVDMAAAAHRLSETAFDTAELPSEDETVVIVPAAP